MTQAFIGIRGVCAQTTFLDQRGAGNYNAIEMTPIVQRAIKMKKRRLCSGICFEKCVTFLALLHGIMEEVYQKRP